MLARVSRNPPPNSLVRDRSAPAVEEPPKDTQNAATTMVARYYLLSLTGICILQYFLLTGIRAEAVVTDRAEKLQREATRSFSTLVDLISDSRSGLRGSFSSQDIEPIVTAPLEFEDGDVSTMIFADDQMLQAMIDYYGEYHQIDPLLVRLIIEQESAFDPLALSPTGAMGLMQLMPDTAWLLGVDDPFEPEQNIEAGVRYFAQQMDRFGNLELALAAYNAGPGAVESWGGVPPYPETVDYVSTIVGRYLAESNPEGVSDVVSAEPAVDPETVESGEPLPDFDAPLD